MRRTDREITDIAEKLKIIGKCKVCRLGMALDNRAYVVPLNFGYEYIDGKLAFYFHGAEAGEKIEILRQNPNVCVEMDAGHQLIEGETAYTYSFAYESIIAFGEVEFLVKTEEKSHALNVLMRHQTGKDTPWVFDKQQLDAVCIYKLTAASFTGKRREMPAAK
jgi:nitroimidazol reductase NimA-like FMN-containing flavoprotein (pyridoxamine 5'-phosphate oxidase superfamily)